MGLDDEKSRRHPRWTRQENLTLIQAKEITENAPNKGKKISSALMGNAARGGSSSSSLLSDNTEPKWVVIASYCKKQGVKRGPAQCRKRWSNLMGDFKKVKAWEDKLEDKADSFWTMRNDSRKERKLPVSFDIEVFKVLEGRETGGSGVVSPVPLQAVAPAAATATDTDTAAVTDDANEFGDEEVVEEEEVDQEDEQMLNGGEFVSGLKDGQDNIKTTDNVTESPIKKFTPEPITEEQHHQAFEGQNQNSNQDDPTESWPDISTRDSQDKGKRRRLSTDDHNANCSEAQILRLLEANNKLLNAQLENHNKNYQLDREQRKECNTELVATLSKLTDVLIKLAEKL